MAERVVAARRIRTAPPVDAPIFILGHWRSGTTHLYNVLSRSTRFGFVTPVATALPWDCLVLARLIRPILERALPSNRFIDAIPVNPDSPQEDEIALANMLTLSYYHGLYFPRRLRQHLERGLFFDGATPRQVETWRRTVCYYYAKLSLVSEGRRLVIKNPVYTSRITMLREMYPDARFIHIYRNPYHVFRSMRNFYRALFEELALQPADRSIIDDVIISVYSRMMSEYLEQSAALGPHELIELKFEDFERDPLGGIEQIYGRLSIEGFDQDRPRFAEYLETVRSYRKNTYTRPAEGADLVTRHWGRFLEHFGYEPSDGPDASASPVPEAGSGAAVSVVSPSRVSESPASSD